MALVRAILIVGAVALAAIGALAGAGFFDGMLRPDEIARERQKRVAATGIQQRLSERYGDELRFFIIGRQIDDTRWDFRGQVVQGAEAQPLYGVARRSCGSDDADDAACWDLERLAVNGAELLEDAGTLSGGASPAIETTTAVASGPASIAASGGVAIDTSVDTAGTQSAETASPDTRPEDQAVAAAAPNASQDAATPDAATPDEPTVATRSAAPPQPTHVVSGTEVNVRAGPGLEFETIGVIFQGQDLEMLEDRGEWGRFRFIGGENDGVEAWLFKPLTRPRG